MEQGGGGGGRMGPPGSSSAGVATGSLAPAASASPPEAARPVARLFGYLSRYRGSLWLASGASILNKILDLMPPLLVGWVIDALRGAPPSWIARLAGSSDPWRMAVALSCLAVAIFVFESLFQWAYQAGFMRLAQRVQPDLRLAALPRIPARDMPFFQGH